MNIVYPGRGVSQHADLHVSVVRKWPVLNACVVYECVSGMVCIGYIIRENMIHVNADVACCIETGEGPSAQKEWYLKCPIRVDSSCCLAVWQLSLSATHSCTL